MGSKAKTQRSMRLNLGSSPQSRAKDVEHKKPLKKKNVLGAFFGGFVLGTAICNQKTLLIGGIWKVLLVASGR